MEVTFYKEKSAFSEYCTVVHAKHCSTLLSYMILRDLPGHVVGEGSHVLEEVGAVPALHVLHHHAQVLPALKAAVHRHHERVVGEGEDVPLGEHLLHLYTHCTVYCTVLYCTASPDCGG